MHDIFFYDLLTENNQKTKPKPEKQQQQQQYPGPNLFNALSDTPKIL